MPCHSIDSPSDGGFKTDAEKRRVRTYQTRKLWEEQVTDMETDNREQFKELLAEEDLRRMRTKPEPDPPDDSGLPLCDIPRCLIEATPEQMESLRQKPAYTPTLDEHTKTLRQQTKD